MNERVTKVEIQMTLKSMKTILKETFLTVLFMTHNVCYQDRFYD